MHDPCKLICARKQLNAVKNNNLVEFMKFTNEIRDNLKDLTFFMVLYCVTYMLL